MRFIFVIICLVACKNSVFTQTIDALKKKQIEIERSIELLNSQIDQTEKQKKNALLNYNLVGQKIVLKQRLISDLEKQIALINSKIFSISNSVDSLNYLILLKRNEYKRFLTQIQKRNFSTPILLYILSSNSFSEVHRKTVYFNEYLNYQKGLIKILSHSTKELKVQKNELDINLIEVKEKERLKEDEVKRLESTRNEHKRKSKSLQNKKKELLKELELSKSISIKLEKEIELLIAEERKKLSEGKNKKSIEQSSVLSKNFSDNKGKFLLPVRNGVIVNNFGEKDHPILKNIKVKNNGVDISFSESSEVYTVFNGEVRKVFKIPGSKLAVMIRHGNFITVYSNLSDVLVKNGQEVSTNQKIGYVKRGNFEESLILHFEIWNENKPENPIYYLRD